MINNHKRMFAVIAVICTLLFGSSAVTATGKINRKAQTVVDVEFLGEVVVPTGTTFEGTEIGGLSSITFDAKRGVYYAISDDQGNRETEDPVRYYDIEIDLLDGRLDAGDVTFLDVTQLFDRKQKPFEPGGLDPEGIVLARSRFLFVSSEGNISTDPIIDPFIRRYTRKGRPAGKLPIPTKYIPNGEDFGVRQNLSFESLNLTPNQRYLVTAGEGALFQDGPASTFEDGSLTRILIYDMKNRRPIREFVYELAPWAEPSDIFGVNGIVEVLPIDNVNTMLVMERSFSVGGQLGGGTGNVVVINEVSIDEATNVLHIDALYEDGAPIDFTPVSQRQIFAFDDLGLPIDNIEGMTFGPTLPDGRKTLVIVSDNNFNAGQFTQFIVLALEIDSVSRK